MLFKVFYTFLKRVLMKGSDSSGKDWITDNFFQCGIGNAIDIVEGIILLISELA
jgi:hypothetical protein